MRTLIGLIIIVWLVIGVLAAFQRGYFGDDRDVTCKIDRRHRAHHRRRATELRRRQPEDQVQHPAALP